MTFLRLQVVGVLRRCCGRPSSSAALKCHYSGLPTSSFISTPSSALTSSRALSTTWILRKDVPQPKDEEARPKLDLDVWKSMMRTVALQEDRVKTKDKVEDEDKEETSTDESKEVEGKLSPLEATRMLVDAWRLAGRLVPDSLTDEQMEALSKLTTKSSKRKFLKHLSIKEGYKKAKMEKKEKKMAERMERADREGVDVDSKADVKLKNTFLMKFWSRSLDTLLFWRSAQAMQYGQPLVFDMSYDQHMSSHDAKNTVSQLLQCEGWNRRSVDPFHLHFCNLQPNSVYHQELLKRYGQETWERLFITTTSQRHVDIFPRENLVYLTADSPNVLRTFDHNKVYIIGAFVDRSAQSGVSLANAKRLKLATARLPLNEHLQWDCGAKNLTLDQMIQILITIKETGSWEKALEFVPIRKHGGFYEQKTENSVPDVTSAPYTAPFRATATTYSGSQRDRAPLFVSKRRIRNQTEEKPAFKSEQMFGQTRLRTGLKSKIEEHSRAMREKKKWSKRT
ncbi:tRNA methyltransferase 10 homolog C [Astyanax mexicanus]|uniref:tRNA methyltransferase 10 homolog C n=1 Tax=Astyanax mexicanus TaxID=7994 RepID=UPI0020CAF5E6|nr:tRNA methyltransferase 10 homolog C [Astyanax mexicanus]